MSGELYLGIMSGTSLDGIDIALCELQPKQCRLLAASGFAFPESLRQQLLALNQQPQITLPQLGELDHWLAECYAECVNQFLKQQAYCAQQIRAIGCHGQTVYHAPQAQHPFTMQLGDANLLAVQTEITTVADFRRKDIALGGQGAPLVPAFHAAMFADPQRLRVILNLGGIANITVLKPEQAIIGYDTGPANALLDSWIAQHLQQDFDHHGDWAAGGTVDQALLARLLADDYFRRRPPKSTGREYFNLNWLQSQLSSSKVSPQNVQATLAQLTVDTIVAELDDLAQDCALPRELIICGGGAKNRHLMQLLAAKLPQWQLNPSDVYGIDADYLEAMAFAWLAYRRIHNLPSNLPSVTGARTAVSLGVIYPA